LPNFDLTGKPDTPTRGGIRKSLLTGEGKRVPQVARALCGNLPRNSSTTQDKKKTQKLKKKPLREILLSFCATQATQKTKMKKDNQ